MSDAPAPSVTPGQARGDTSPVFTGEELKTEGRRGELLPRLRGRGTRRVEGAFAALAASLTPATALAHEGHHGQMSALQLVRHIVTQPDHLLALGGLAVLAAAFTWRLTRSPAKVRIRK